MTRTEPARGMRDFLPEDIRRREYVIGVIRRVYERYGFEPLETPAVENLDTLMGKYGDEGNQLIFKILKRGEHEASGQADLALRYDLTVPLARVVAHYQSKLPRLFKRYQIQPVWRADRPARGRFREFYQCDVDALGSTSPVIEAEVCAAVSDALTELGFSDFTIRINHRQLLTSILKVAGIPETLHGTALVAVDKLDKIGPDGVKTEMQRARNRQRRGGQAARAVRVVANDRLGSRSGFSRMRLGSAAFENVAAIFALAAQNERGPAGCGSIRALRGGCRTTRAPSWRSTCPTSPAVSAAADATTTSWACSSGSRVPACGFSLGLERILVVMAERGMFPPTLATTPADVMMAVFDATDTPHALRVAGLLRQSGLRVLVYPDADKIGKQIKYADSLGIPFVAILGGNEIAAGTVTVKNLDCPDAGNLRSSRRRRRHSRGTEATWLSNLAT